MRKLWTQISTSRQKIAIRSRDPRVWCVDEGDYLPPVSENGRGTLSELHHEEHRIVDKTLSLLDAGPATGTDRC